MGRDRDAQLVVLSEQVSRRHAEIHREGSRLRLRDLGSRNATTVNGEPVRGWTDRADGDVIRFGDVEAVVELVGHDDPPDFATGPTRPTERTGVPASRVPVFVSHSSADKSTVRA
ncbi:MAG TPA: FHA domain-containing protein, partial [Pseudonocardia sp.]